MSKDGTKGLDELFEQSERCTKSATGPNLFKWDVCTNMRFQTIPRRLLHFGRRSQSPREAGRFSPGSLDCNCFWGYVCVCMCGGLGREEGRSRGDGERALEAQLRALLRGKCALSMKSTTPRRLWAREREVNRAYFIGVKSAETLLLGQFYVYSRAFQMPQW